MLNSVFVWLDGHPGIYWIIAGLATLLWFARIWSAWRLEAHRDHPPVTTARWPDALILFLFLLGWRWPFLLAAGEFNPDESQLIAGAITLSRDPVFWRAVDGATSGPLNFYILLPWHWLGLPLDYFTARLTGLLLIWGALFACHRTVEGCFGRIIAWLSILPATLFFATATHFDLIHYSSEHVPLFLCALSVGLLVARKDEEFHRLWAASFIAGLSVWAKLQALPLVGVLVGWGLWQTLRARPPRLKHAAGAGLAAVLPSLIAVGCILATGQTEAAYRRYIVHNALYVGNARPVNEVWREMTAMAVSDGRLPWLLTTTLLVLVVASIYYTTRRRRPPALFILGGLLALSALLAILIPRREYLHYSLLLPVPLAIWTGGALGGWWSGMSSLRHRRRFVGLTLLASSLPLLLTRAVQPVAEPFGQFAYDWRHPRSGAAEIINALAQKKDSLGIWGWACHLNVEAGLPQATRDGNAIWCIMPNPQREYRRACYLSDLRRHEPAVFVDAVGPDAFGFKHRENEAHEIFPELADYIRLNYKLVTDLGDARIYARNGLGRIATLTPQRLTELTAFPRGSNVIAPPITSLDHYQRKTIARKNVVMLLPPAKIEWQLDDDVRKIILGFGFDPVAYLEGKSNGAEVILELVNAGHTRPLYHHYLDPQQRAEDRSLQTIAVSLPPFQPGTRLVLRTDAGPFGDTAWDWIYLENLQLIHSPRFLSSQFPGFNRVPDSAEAEGAWLDAGRRLSLPAPSALTYTLYGWENQLSFDYGFEPGAYTNGGNTDGAIFRVELKRTNQPTRTIYEHALRPLTDPEDRAVHHIGLTLTNCHPSDRLTLSIDPGPAGNASWDWTFISNLILE